MGMEEAEPKQSWVDGRGTGGERESRRQVSAQRASRLREVSRKEKEPCLERVRGELG